MTIELAEKYGFCFGVKRAIKIAEENQNSATYGPLIHNSKEIERLKKDFNVALRENIQEFKQGDTAVVRTHGIEKEELEFLKEQDINVIDATCPYVTKPQHICEQMSDEGYDILIFGDANHPEIKGVRSYATGNVYVVNNLEETKAIHFHEKIACVAQTTRKIEDYLEIINYLIPQYKEVRTFNTICNATFENQEAVRKLADKADIMIIIGGKNSSNTKQLHSIAKSLCSDSYHIEGANELNSEWFKNKKYCGVSAGASTPDWIIEEILDKIKELS